MKKEKVLFLIESDSSKILYNELKDNGFNVDYFFSELSRPLRIVRRIWLKFNLPWSQFWFGNWFNYLNEYNSIIINMNYLNHKLLDIISKKYPDLKIIGWYWNTVDSSNYPIKNSYNNIEYWSFDDKDCKKYGFKKNIQYYSEQNVINCNNKIIDIYFVGREKGRSNQIYKIKEIAEKQNLFCDFNIVNDSSIIPYSDVKSKLAISKSVLEINKDDQIGFTLRTLESLFFRIKLITNNKNIVNSRIYNKNNVFIIGVDDMNNLYSFVNNEYDNSVDIYKKDFDIDTWFNNFFKE